MKPSTTVLDDIYVEFSERDYDIWRKDRKIKQGQRVIYSTSKKIVSKTCSCKFHRNGRINNSDVKTKDEDII